MNFIHVSSIGGKTAIEKGVNREKDVSQCNFLKQSPIYTRRLLT